MTRRLKQEESVLETADLPQKPLTTLRYGQPALGLAVRDGQKTSAKIILNREQYFLDTAESPSYPPPSGPIFREALRFQRKIPQKEHQCKKMNFRGKKKKIKKKKSELSFRFLEIVVYFCYLYSGVIIFTNFPWCVSGKGFIRQCDYQYVIIQSWKYSLIFYCVPFQIIQGKCYLALAEISYLSFQIKVSPVCVVINK